MKRINEQTGKHFTKGDTDEAGRMFWAYSLRIKQTGYYAERWLDADEYREQTKKAKQKSFNLSQTQMGRLRQITRHSKSSAKKRGHLNDITLEEVVSMWDKQKGLCAYTNWPMGFATRSDNLVSIERIDNTSGYTLSNCVLACWCVNKARGSMEQSDFVAMCRAIVDNVTNSN